MKTKHLFITAAASVPVCALLRVLQHIFIIDQNGCFEINSIADRLLASSLYVVFVLLAMFALAHVIRSGREALDGACLTAVPSLGFLFILISALQLYYSGYGFGNMLRSVMSTSFDVMPVLLLLSALFFIMYGVTLLTGKKTNVIHKLLGFFPPVYMAAVGILSFFDSFDSASVSYNEFKTMSLCASALLLFCISSTLAGVKVKLRRFTALAMLYTAFASASALGEVYALFTSTKELEDIILMATHALLIAAALILLYRARPAAEVVQEVEDSEEFAESVDLYNKMNIYIDDIKEETEDDQDNRA